MSTQTGKWREEQILIICPGSHTTLAQLGCAELTPPAYRFPTRMFKDEETDGWRPYYTYRRSKTANGAAANGEAQAEEDWEYVEDPDATDEAVYPIEGGRIVNMEAFLAFLEHVHSMLTTTYHNTPIMLMASPQWTRPDCEAIAQYIFEKTRTPALCLLHSGIATQYGLKWPHMTVVDIGFEKVDVTCIYESRVVNHMELGNPIEGGLVKEISGGEVFTQRLMELLKEKNFTHDMAEQLKKSPICEVLPYAPELPELMELPYENPPASAAAPAAAPVQQSGTEGPRIVEPQGQAGVDVDDDGMNGEDKAVDNDGVLDVASIVASGQTKEFLAKKEKEKAEKAKAGRRGKDKEAEAAAAKPTRLPNSKRARNIFHYEEYLPKDADEKEKEAGTEGAPREIVTGPPAPDSDKPAEAPAAEDASKPGEQSLSFFPSDEPSAAPAASASATATAEQKLKKDRRDIEIGLERFKFADRAEIDRIVTTIYRAVQGIEDMYMRPSCWENIVFVGNGCRIKGLKDNIMQTLNARHLISPSSATMFTSELPSNLATPSGTGSQTPTGNFTAPPHQLPTSSSVNPLLQAATTASLAIPGGTPGAATPGGTGPGGENGGVVHSHHFHSQTPTAIKLAQLPTYLSEWTKNGFEEAMFLGAQVAARLAFCVHNMDAQGLEAQRLMSLNRVDYNELGPKGVRSHSMLG